MVEVSVIIPLYNGEAYIAETLSMLMKSRLEKIEFIVIDDGSSDSGYRICQEYQKKDKRIRIFQKENEAGVYATRNYGLKKALGKYVCFCDQDDVVDPDMYEILYAEAEKKNADVVMCSTGKMIGSDREEYEKLLDCEYIERGQINKLILKNIFVNTRLYEEQGIYIGNSIWKCMIKREFIEKNNICFRRYINYEDDWLFMLDILARADRVITMSKVLYFWRINLKSETYTTNYVEDMYEKGVRLKRELNEILEIAGISEKYRLLFDRHYNCTRYVELIENELRNKEKYSEKKAYQYIKRIYAESDMKASLKMRKKYCNNLLRKKVGLMFLQVNCISGAYLFLRLFNRIKMFSLKSNIWTKLENKIKG